MTSLLLAALVFSAAPMYEAEIIFPHDTVHDHSWGEFPELIDDDTLPTRLETEHWRFRRATPASRSERIAKYNQLLRIEEELGARAVYAGRSILRG